MCAIHGFLGNTVENIQKMIAAAHHRGPDGSGTWNDHLVTLGHNLLAIADTADKSKQPWYGNRGVLVFNGEIYNYRDLRRGIASQFHTDTDTEVLLAGLETRGADFLRRVDGMFALAYYDYMDNTLLLARDSNGAKPLYYTKAVSGGFAFSSEIRSLLALDIPRRVSRDGFRHYYHAGLVAGPLTIFDAVKRVIPGDVLTFDAKNGYVKHGFNLNNAATASFTGSLEDVPELLSAKLKQAVQLTWTGTRQRGMLLSGGMDSSAVLYEMVKSGFQPRTFSTRFEVPHARCNHNDDADTAEFLAKTYQLKHREAFVDQQTWVANFTKAIVAMEEPRQGKSYAAYYQTLRVMRDYGVIVAYTGDGGDELLMGYKHQLTPDFRKRFEGLRAGHREFKNYELRIDVDEQMEYLNAWMPVGAYDTFSDINQFMRMECLHTLSEDFLIRNDKLGAAFGMETRFPMLCNVFRDFVRSLPGRWKQGTGSSWAVATKALLRSAYQGKLPERIISKAKTGWKAPTNDWIIGIPSAPAPDHGIVRDFIREAFRDSAVCELLEITEETIEKRYLSQDFTAAAKRSGKPGVPVGLASQKELFAALTFAIWFKEFNMELW